MAQVATAMKQRHEGVVPWSAVEGHCDRVAIVATGPSLRFFDLELLRGLDVIAVNGAILALPFEPTAWVTIDTSPANRAIMRARLRWPTTEFYAAVPSDYGLGISPNRRPPVEPHIRYIRRLDRLHHKYLGLSDDPAAVLTGNSSYGALNVAWLKGARRVALLGVDGAGGYAWAPGAPRNLSDLPRLFGEAAQKLRNAGVEVRVGSLESKVRAWPRVSPEEAVAWLRS